MNVKKSVMIHFAQHVAEMMLTSEIQIKTVPAYLLPGIMEEYVQVVENKIIF
jgi:hypothetical protein